MIAQDGLVDRARASIASRRLRNHLQAVAKGERQNVAIDLGDPMVDTAAVIGQVTRQFGPGSAELDRIAAVMHPTGLYDTMLDQLNAQEPSRRVRSAKLVGALRIEAAVPALVAMLSASDRAARNAAARALGRIGGTRGAAGLLDAARHGAHGPSMVVGLAQAAPDLFLEAALGEEEPGTAGVMVAAAVGLRRRRAAVRPLLVMLQGGVPSERAASCRALGWIGAVSAAPAVAAALDDPNWRVRLSAAKTLARLRAGGYARDLTRLLADRHLRVRRAARTALQGLPE